MTTSGTTSFNQTKDDIVRMALIDVGFIGVSEQTVDQRIVKFAGDKFDLLIKSLDGRGARLYQMVRRTFTTVAGQQAYVLSSDVWDVDKPARYTPPGSTTAISVFPMSASQWMMTSDRSIQGTPVQYYIEKQLDPNGVQFVTMYFYLVPSEAGLVEYRAILQAQDSGTGANTPYFSSKWLSALNLGLVAALSPASAASAAEKQAREAAFEAEFSRQINSDTEIADLQEMPSFNYISRGY